MLEKELEVALSAVHSAAAISRAVQQELIGGWNKTDDSPVTVADLAVQAHISALLTDAFPGDPLMAEESGEMLEDPERLGLVAKYMALARPGIHGPREVVEWIERGQKPVDRQQRYWILDPIDGTKGFLRKEQYAIALALVERGRILVGVLGCPNLSPQSTVQSPQAAGSAEASGGGPWPTPVPVDCGLQAVDSSPGQIYFAVRGEGAFSVSIPTGKPLDVSSRQPVRVSPVDDPAQATWCERVESSQGNKNLSTEALRRAGITAEPMRLDSQAKYAVVARGDAAVYLRHTLKPDYREKVWDHAAGVIVIEEAGGKVTDISGRPLDFSLGRTLEDNRGIIATNGRLHDRVLCAVQEVIRGT